MPRPTDIDVIYIPRSTHLSFLDLGTFIIEVRKLKRQSPDENREATQIVGLLKQELEYLIERQRLSLKRREELERKIQEAKVQAEVEAEEDEIQAATRLSIGRIFDTVRLGDQDQDRDFITGWKWELSSLVKSFETDINLRIEFLCASLGTWGSAVEGWK